MIFYINPLITTKNTYGTHTHTQRHRNQNLSIPRKKKKKKKKHNGKQQEEKEGQNNYKQKTVNKMAIVSPSLSITMLNGNGLNSPVKRH